MSLEFVFYGQINESKYRYCSRGIPHLDLFNCFQKKTALSEVVVNEGNFSIRINILGSSLYFQLILCFSDLE